MKRNKETRDSGLPRVERVLLQMSRRGNDWAGKATSFAGPAEYHFNSLKDLAAWLDRCVKR
jgi:hypothetical protein